MRACTYDRYVVVIVTLHLPRRTPHPPPVIRNYRIRRRRDVRSAREESERDGKRALGGRARRTPDGPKVVRAARESTTPSVDDRLTISGTTPTEPHRRRTGNRGIPYHTVFANLSGRERVPSDFSDFRGSGLRQTIMSGSSSFRLTACVCLLVVSGLGCVRAVHDKCESKRSVINGRGELALNDSSKTTLPGRYAYATTAVEQQPSTADRDKNVTFLARDDPFDDGKSDMFGIQF